jgi:hypothetical protein
MVERDLLQSALPPVDRVVSLSTEGANSLFPEATIRIRDMNDDRRSIIYLPCQRTLGYSRLLRLLVVIFGYSRLLLVILGYRRLSRSYSGLLPVPGGYGKVISGYSRLLTVMERLLAVILGY